MLDENSLFTASLQFDSPVKDPLNKMCVLQALAWALK